MARIRSIKPEFWSDEKLSECSLSARLLFIALWNFADDEGRMEFAPARIKMQVFPCGSVSASKLTEYLRELTEKSVIRIYTYESKQYLDIPNFTKHQKINRPTPSRLPAFHGGLTESSAIAHVPLTSGKEGNGREGNRARGTRLPDNFTLTPERRKAAEAEGVDAEREFAKFRDYWAGQPGAKGVKLDWDATWRNWCRSDFAPKAKGPGGIQWA